MKMVEVFTLAHMQIVFVGIAGRNKLLHKMKPQS